MKNPDIKKEIDERLTNLNNNLEHIWGQEEDYCKGAMLELEDLKEWLIKNLNNKCL